MLQNRKILGFRSFYKDAAI